LSEVFEYEDKDGKRFTDSWPDFPSLLKNFYIIFIYSYFLTV